MSNDTKTPATVTTPASKPVTRNSRNWLALIALALAFASTAGGWFLYQREVKPLRATLDAGLASNDQATTSLIGEVHALREALQASDTARAAQDAAVAELTAAIAELSAKVDAPDEPVIARLHDARLRSLLESAALALRFERDLARADAALAAALAELDPDIPADVTLGRALEADRAALKAFAEPDTATLAAQWAAAAAAVDAFPWRAGELTSPTAAPQDQSVSGWQGIALAMWRDLLQLIQIKEKTGIDDELLHPSRAALVRAGLQSELAALRWGTLRRDTAAAHTSAAAVKRMLEQYFDAEDAGVADLSLKLQAMLEVELAPSLPPLTSLTLLPSSSPSPPSPAAPDATPIPEAGTTDSPSDETLTTPAPRDMM